MNINFTMFKSHRFTLVTAILLTFFPGCIKNAMTLTYTENAEPSQAKKISIQNDSDQDGILNSKDNCKNDWNPNQANLDGDKFGDVCDDDIDEDGIANDPKAPFNRLISSHTDVFPYCPNSNSSTSFILDATTIGNRDTTITLDELAKLKITKDKEVPCAIVGHLKINLSKKDTSRNTIIFRLLQRNLQHILGKLIIDKDFDLSHINFQQLKYVNHQIDIQSNKVLEEIRFDSLLVVGGNVHLANNLRLSSVKFPTLNKLGCKLQLSANKSLEMIALPRLEVIKSLAPYYSPVGERECFYRGIQISENPSFRLLHIPRLRYVDSEINIIQNSSLQQLRFLSLEEITDVLDLKENSSLAFAAFPKLRRIGDRLRAQFNPSMKSLQMPSLAEGSFSSLDIYIDRNRSMEELHFPELIETDSIEIYFLPKLKSIQFPKLRNTSIDIVGNNALKEIDLPFLLKSFKINISSNDQISSLNLPSLREISNNLEIIKNKLLKQVHLPILNNIKKSLLVKENRYLESLSIPKLRLVEDRVFISKNPQLQLLNLSSFESFGDSFDHLYFTRYPDDKIPEYEFRIHIFENTSLGLSTNDKFLSSGFITKDEFLSLQKKINQLTNRDGSPMFGSLKLPFDHPKLKEIETDIVIRDKQSL